MFDRKKDQEDKQTLLKLLNGISNSLHELKEIGIIARDSLLRNGMRGGMVSLSFDEEGCFGDGDYVDAHRVRRIAPMRVDDVHSPYPIGCWSVCIICDGGDNVILPAKNREAAEIKAAILCQRVARARQFYSGKPQEGK